jgi:hypothetical protein
MIASFYDGRIRIRAEALKNPATLDMVRGLITEHRGVLEATVNPRTGSLLVCYDPQEISRESLLTAAEMLEQQIASHTPKNKDAGRRTPRRAETAVLASLYALTVAGGFVNTRVHVAAGALFTLLAALHLYNRKQCL